MPTFVNDNIQAVFPRVNGSGGGTLPMLETPTNGMVNAQGTADGETMVSIKASELASLATQATLADILARVPALGQAIAKASTPVVLTAIQQALLGTIRHGTTPSKADLETGPIESDRRGNTFMRASPRHRRQVILTSGLAASAASLTEGPCDAMRVDTDDIIVYAQPVERALMATQTGSAWTGAAGWSYDAGTNAWTHAAGGGTGDLEITTTGDNATVVGTAYAVCCSPTITAGTSLTPKLGTGAATAITTSGDKVSLATATGSTKIIFTPTNDLACVIPMSSVYVIPGTPPLKDGEDYAESAIKVVAVASKATPATPHATAKVWLRWLRRAGAVEVT